MRVSPMLALHIAGGTLALLSGFPAIFLRKGSPAHRVAGNIFVVSMIVLGGLSGTQRLIRHLSRMCFALFVAAGSVFLARAHLFPAFIRKSGTLFILSFLPLLLMVFWRLRVRSPKMHPGKPVPRRME